MMTKNAGERAEEVMISYDDIPVGSDVRLFARSFSGKLRDRQRSIRPTNHRIGEVLQVGADVVEVNYFGVVELLEGFRDALTKTERAKVLVFASNATTTTPAVPGRAIRAMLAGHSERAVRATRIFGNSAPAMAYGAAKIAVSRWVRRQAVTARWAGAGIRLNALAPGAILTPLLQKQLAMPSEAKAIHSFPVPIGGFGVPGQLADWVVFVLSDAADFLCGSIVFVDGGSDAWFRADDWPRAVPARRVPWYLKRMLAFAERR